MKKILLAILIAVGLVGCAKDKIDPDLIYIAALGCNTLGLQFEGVDQKSNWSDDTITITANCSQNIQIVINGIPKNRMSQAAPVKQSGKALKDA